MAFTDRTRIRSEGKPRIPFPKILCWGLALWLGQPRNVREGVRFAVTQTPAQDSGESSQDVGANRRFYRFVTTTKAVKNLNGDLGNGGKYASNEHLRRLVT